MPVLTKSINLSFRNGFFPDDLKAAQFSPNFNKNDGLCKENYEPWGFLKELCIIKWKVSWKLSKLLKRFRKNHGM